MSSRRWRSARERDIENQAGALHPLERTSSKYDARVRKTRSHSLELFGPQESTDIRVGKGDDARVFHVNKNLICKFTEYFVGECLSNPIDGLDLAEDDPVVFDMFLEWIKNPECPVSYNPDGYSEEPWLSNAAAAWVLAKKLRAVEFEKYALSQFIQNCALLAFGPWKYIETMAPLGSSIRRFSDHWVAWNYHLAGPGRNEFSDLQGKVGAVLVTEKTRDPRIFDIDHWYLTCGDDINPSCAHDPIARQEKLQQESHRPDPPPEWGRSLELQREGGHHRGSSSSSSQDTSVQPVPPLGGYTPRHTFTPAPPIYGYTRPPSPPVYQIPTWPPTYRSPYVRSSPAASSYDDCHCLKSWVKGIIALVFVAQAVAITILSVLMFLHPESGVRFTTRIYGLVVSALCGLAVFVPWVSLVYIIFGIGGGIATVLDMLSCRSTLGVTTYGYYYYGATQSTQACQNIMFLMILIWSSVPVSAAYFFIWPSRWRRCECC